MNARRMHTLQLAQKGITFSPGMWLSDATSCSYTRSSSRSFDVMVMVLPSPSGSGMLTADGVFTSSISRISA